LTENGGPEIRGPKKTINNNYKILEGGKWRAKLQEVENAGKCC